MTADGPGRVLSIVHGNRWQLGRVMVELDSGHRRYYQASKVWEEEE